MPFGHRNRASGLPIILHADPVGKKEIGALGRYITPMKPSPGLLFLLCTVPLVGCASTTPRSISPVVQVRFQDLNGVPAPSTERYYLLVFSSQTIPKIPRFTHCWATVAKVADCGPSAPPSVAQDTISWMPATLHVRPWRFRVERGENLDVHSSISTGLDHRERVSVWGPFEVSAGFYRKFLMQKTFLESGRIGYQCIDVVGEAARCGNGSNCIHALADMDMLFDRRAFPIFRFGDAASESVVKHLAERGAILNPCRTHDWLLPALGLDRYPLVRRSYSVQTGPPR
jgi:hypothetical protein